MTEAVDMSASSQPAADAGAWLRFGREQAGLSIDMVAQQLKLAPRQVRALEDGNFAELPGRTFVRGFVRNYARLLRLDPEAVVAALPDAESAPALEGPSIGSASRPMGELPVSYASRGASWSRWVIPAALIAAVIVAAVYEFMRPAEVARPDARMTVKPLPVEPAVPTAAIGTPLPNPVAGVPAGAESPSAPAVDPLPPPAPAVTESATAPAAPPAPAVAEATLVIRYKAAAWTQVKDASGQTLLVTNGQPGASETLSARPPLDLVIGNAAATSVVWRGQPFDLAPHTRANVVRAQLP